MVPSGDITRSTITELGELLGEGDLVVDGGNSRWTDDQANAAMLAEKGIGFVDCGVSGGVWGLKNGYALMCGGANEEIAKVQPVFDALKPEGEFGFVHAGEAGAGHFAKMVHNGIEYAIMQAYAEGWELLEAADVVDNVPEIFDSWREGTVIRSWLLDLLVDALDEDDAPRRDPRVRRRLRRGPVDRRGGDRPRRADAGDRRLAVRPVRLPPGRLPGDEGGRRHAQPVRRSRGQDRRPRRRRRRPRAARHVHVAHLTLHDFRSWPGVDVELGPGRHGVRRAATARARRTWSRRSTTWPGSPRTGSPGRAAGARRRRAGGRAGRGGARRATGRARGGDQPGPLQPGPGQPLAAAAARDLLGLVRRVLFAPEDLALVKGDPSDRRRFLDDLLVHAPAALRRRPRRLRAGAQAAQVAAQDRRRRPARRPVGRRSRRCRTLGVWDAQLARAGRRDGGRADAAGRRAGPLWARRTPTVAAGRHAATTHGGATAAPSCRRARRRAAGPGGRRSRRRCSRS